MQRKPILIGVSESGTADRMAPGACEACARKIRCLRDLSFSDVSCKPCVFANRACVYPGPSPKKRRKRTETRVTELEKTVNALSTALHGSVNGVSAIRENVDTIEDYLQCNPDKGIPAAKPSVPALKLTPALPGAQELSNMDVGNVSKSNAGSRFIAPDKITAPRMIDNLHNFPD